MKKHIYLTIVLIFLTGVFAGAAPPDIAPEIINAFDKAGLSLLDKKQEIKDFTLKLVKGGNVQLSSLKGKVVFLNFWATWCPPCRIEMPSMENMYQQFNGKAIEFVVVNIREDEEDVKYFLDYFKFNFPVALDLDGGVAANYGIEGIPTTIIIGKDGKIIIEEVGSRDWNTPEMIDAINILIQHD
ncbi:MAG: TlpA family protein disulfide reductase [Treponema sp.]|nr:TlpA family protein disulfide reductase [Treponema sp.]